MIQLLIFHHFLVTAFQVLTKIFPNLIWHRLLNQFHIRRSVSKLRRNKCLLIRLKTYLVIRQYFNFITGTTLSIPLWYFFVACIHHRIYQYNIFIKHCPQTLIPFFLLSLLKYIVVFYIILCKALLFPLIKSWWIPHHTPICWLSILCRWF